MSSFSLIIFLLVVFQGFDVYTTKLVLSLPGGYEANPVMKWLMGLTPYWWVAKIAIGAAMCTGLLLLEPLYPTYARWAAVALFILYAYIIMHNYSLYREHR